MFHAYATPLSPSLTTFVWPSEVPVENQMNCWIMYEIINTIQKGQNHSTLSSIEHKYKFKNVIRSDINKYILKNS
jgi:hypothetical protein